MISYGLGIDALCPHLLPCECGSGSNLRGDGHAYYCQLLGESKYEARDSNDPGPVAELILNQQWKQWYIPYKVPQTEYYNFGDKSWHTLTSVDCQWIIVDPNEYSVNLTQSFRNPIKDDRRDYLNKLYTLQGEEVCD